MKTNPGLNDRMYRKGYISGLEAVERSGIARSTLYDALNDGRIKGIKIGARRYVELKSFLEYLGEAAFELTPQEVKILKKVPGKRAKSAVA